MSEFYSGQTARKISDFFNSNGGILSQTDLLQYKVKESKSICGSYRVYKVCSMPLPSSGGIALIQMLNILENFNLSEIEHNSEEYLKILISVMNYAFYDRAKYLGDSEFFNVPQKILTSKKYGKNIYDRISKNIRPSASNIIFSESEETTHFSVIDKWGNAVSNTYTLNTAYGSGIVPSGTGILMNNEMDDFSSKPGHPNAYGLVGSEANKIEPNKAPLSSMSPAIVFFEEKPFLVTGSPGGSTIITTVLQEILNIVDFKMTLNESSKKSRIHFQHLPDILFHEKIDDKIKSNLLLDRKLMSRKLGETHSILIKENIVTAYSDKRRPDGKASTIHK
jgi:gamma-glutamyltranspeptidase/glutathione hydrolase